MLAKFRFLDPIIVTGIAVSVALSVILVLIGQDQAVSLLIGLVVTTITLLIDIIARIKESEDKLIQTSVLGAALASDSWLFTILQQITDDYRAVRKLNFAVFVRRMETALINCRDIIHGLSEGHLSTDILSEFSFGISGIQNAQRTIKAVQYANPSYWRTRFGENYQQLNEQAVKRGVKITRIWIQNRETLNNYRDIISAQESMGIQVSIADSTEVPPELLEDFAVIDNRLLVRLQLTLEGHARHELVSIDPIEVEKAENNFDLLLRYVRTPSEYYGQTTSPG